MDIADKDSDWFLATAFGYNDMKQTLHVMVPDGINPTWTGDVAVNQLVRCFRSFVVCRLDTVFICHVYATWLLIGWGACSSVGAVNAACGKSVGTSSVGKHAYSTFNACCLWDFQVCRSPPCSGCGAHALAASRHMDQSPVEHHPSPPSLFGAI